MRVIIKCRGVGNGRGIGIGRRPDGKGNTMKEWTDDKTKDEGVWPLGW
jgi:hypothetical protein